jgi:hypothetical protein
LTFIPSTGIIPEKSDAQGEFEDERENKMACPAAGGMFADPLRLRQERGE